MCSATNHQPATVGGGQVLKTLRTPRSCAPAHLHAKGLGLATHVHRRTLERRKTAAAGAAAFGRTGDPGSCWRCWGAITPIEHQQGRPLDPRQHHAVAVRESDVGWYTGVAIGAGRHRGLSRAPLLACRVSGARSLCTLHTKMCTPLPPFRFWDVGHLPGAKAAPTSIAWTLSDYDDSAWAKGSGVFGYGDKRADFATELNPGTKEEPQTTV